MTQSFIFMEDYICHRCGFITPYVHHNPFTNVEYNFCTRALLFYSHFELSNSRYILSLKHAIIWAAAKQFYWPMCDYVGLPVWPAVNNYLLIQKAAIVRNCTIFTHEYIIFLFRHVYGESYSSNRFKPKFYHNKIKI